MLRLSIAAAVALIAAPAQAEWMEASTEHFVIYSDDSAENIRRFATRLEGLDKVMRVLQNTPDAPVGKANRVTVYVLPSPGQVSKLAGDRMASGFYVPRAGGSAAFVPRYSGTSKTDLTAQTVLLHEYAHHFMFTTWPNAALPTWLIEGFAEFNATALFEHDGDIVIGSAPLHRGYGLLTGNPLPVQRLLTLTTDRLTREQREAVYGRGWLLHHYLTFEKSRTGQLEVYVRALNDGKTTAEAARAFGDLDQLAKELDRYLLKRRINAATIAAKLLTIGDVKLRALSAGEAATMPVRIRSKRGVDAEMAKAVVVEARKRAAPFLNDAAAQTVLAEAEYDARDFNAAEAAADRAIAADPKAIDALVYKGMARMARAVEAKDASEATWKDVRRWFVRANRVDPDDPEPLILFYESYGAQGIAPTANSVIGLEQAFALAPQDRSLRMLTARQYLVDGKAPEAKAVLRRIAYDPHGGASAAFAAAQIALLDAGDTAGALAKWNSAPAERESEDGG